MANFYYIIITLLNGEKQVLKGQLNWLSGPIPGAHKKFKKLLNALQMEKDTYWIKDFSVDYES